MILRFSVRNLEGLCGYSSGVKASIRIMPLYKLFLLNEVVSERAGILKSRTLHLICLLTNKARAVAFMSVNWREIVNEWVFLLTKYVGPPIRDYNRTSNKCLCVCFS